MDELIEEFLVETKEGLEVLDNELIELEKRPDDKDIIANLFRVMHTIKGTCGFLGLSRLEKVAHAGEDVMDKVRSGELKASPEIISIILKAVDHIKFLVSFLEENGSEQPGDDSALVAEIKSYATKTGAQPAAVEKKIEQPAPVKPVEKAPAAGAPAQDNADLQALFDATPSLVDIGGNTPENPAKANASPAQDNSDLQALFDATPCLVDIGQQPAAAPAKIEEKPKAEEHKKEEKHAPQNSADQHKKAPTQTIRVGIDVLEELMQHASELVLIRNQLLQLMRANEGNIFTAALQRLSNITTELQEGVMKTRMQPIGNAWTKLPRIVRDLSHELGKKIELKLVGEDTELDRQLLEMIGDPLTHMVRNSADHGIEKTEDRIKSGKPETGTIEIKAYHGGGYIIIEISDDGKGINPDIIKKKAIEKGLITETVAAGLNNSQILQFIFAPGFSTAEKVTSVSGRGVGMDVVKNNIEKISGTVELNSEVGKGSVFTIRIPLTLAIMPVLKIEVQGHNFAIPQINIREVVKTGEKSTFKIEQLSNKPVLRLRGRLLPLVILSEVLGLNQKDSIKDISFIVVCELGNYSFGVIVDQVNDTEEIVVKPVSSILKSISVYSGSTILGDGSVILILDPNSLAKSSGDNSASGQNMLPHDEAAHNEGQKASFVIFKAGDATPKVVPLELLSRLEEIDVTKIEYSRGIPVIQYRGELMRLVSIDPAYKLPKEGMQELLVVTDGSRYMGLVVEAILDIVKAPVTNKITGGKDGFLGPIVIDEKTCDVVDLSYYFKEAFQYDENEENNLTSNSAKLVLLVDDSPFFRKFIPPGMEDAGFSVVCAASGDEAIEKIQKTNFIAIVTDMNMPGMSGVELIKACRQHKNAKDIPIIALSADTEGAKKFETKKIEGIDAFVSKTNHGELINVLQKLVQKREKAA